MDALLAHGLLNSVAAVETGANLLASKDLGDNIEPVLNMLCRQADFLAESLREWIQDSRPVPSGELEP